MPKTSGGSDDGDGWARCPASLEAAPESFAGPTDANDPPDPSGDPTETRDPSEGAPRSYTADTLVQRAMAADPDETVVEYVTFGFGCRRPGE